MPQLSVLGLEALKWVERGWKVIPLQAGTKKPITEHAVRDASDDPRQVKLWWFEFPAANIGGALDGKVVLDVDPKNGGHLTWQKLVDQYGLPETEHHLGGMYPAGRSEHWIFTAQGLTDVRLRMDGLGAGIDVLWSAGKYIVLPPSTHESGVRYEEPDRHAPVALPTWAINLARKSKDSTEPKVPGESQGLDWLLANPPPEDHDRDTWLSRVAGHLARDQKYEDSYRRLLQLINQSLSVPKSAADVDRIATSIWETEHRAELQRVNDLVRTYLEQGQARDIVKQRQAAERIKLPGTEYGTFEEFFAADIPEPTWQVGSLAQVNHNVMLAAQYKTGKTTLLLNLARSLADGVPFLDEFPVTQASESAKVGIWDYEMSLTQFRSWAQESGIENPRHVTHRNLRGLSIPLITTAGRDEALRWLIMNQVKVWIIDPWSGVLGHSGLSENSNDEARLLTDAFDQIKEEAGLDLLVIANHVGRAKAEEGQEHARGATRLDDWVDARWVLTRVTKDEGGTRHFAAEGRDIDLAEGQLTLEGRHLIFDERSRADARAEAAAEDTAFDNEHRFLANRTALEQWCAQHVGERITTKEVRKLFTGKSATMTEHLNEGVARGFWHRVESASSAVNWYPGPNTETHQSIA